MGSSKKGRFSNVAFGFAVLPGVPHRRAAAIPALAGRVLRGSVAAVISTVVEKGALRGSGTANRGSDPRFTFGLLIDVGKVLETHGFPAVEAYTGEDLLRLQRALFDFIHPLDEDKDR
ncbi:hypothetical protein GCM10009545_09330 [Saccharopolyspora thermophila]|uniref:Uncharacterized protein n=2 Tax=Saccharopolyspora thermophila TaxID=89367 RepID=A0ABP3M1S8_9PSEU